MQRPLSFHANGEPMSDRSPVHPLTERGPRARSLASKLAVFGSVVALVASSALVSATAASAASPIVVTTPANGDVDVQQTFPNVVPFAGTGLPAGDFAYVSYLNAAGEVKQATFGSSNRSADGSWTGNQNFAELSQGQTTVVATVVARDVDTLEIDPEVTSTTVTFNLAVAPNPANPFTVTTPTTNSQTPVEDTTPTFSGTGNPGATIEITYGARALQTGTAASVTVGIDGNWTTETDFSELEPGETDGSAIVTEYGIDGEVFPGTSGLRINFVFPSAPAPTIPLTLTTAPESSTLADATTDGVAFLATGFSPNEELTIVVTDSKGGVVELPQSEVSFFADDADGSFIGIVILPTTAGTGTYTITVDGVRSARTVSGEFVVVANPATGGTAGGGATGTLPVVSG